MDVWHAIGRQFRNPSGWVGRAMGGAMRVINRRPNQLAIDALDIAADNVVLELGCGPGAAISDMRRRRPDCVVHGLDQSSVMIGQAARRNRAAIAGGSVCLHLGSFTSIPLPTRSIDRILAVNVAYFWSDMGVVLAEMRRVLKPDGRAVIYVTDAAAMRGWKFAGPDTHRLFDAAGLLRALGAAPFDPAMISILKVEVGFRVAGLIGTIDLQRATFTQAAIAGKEQT